METDNSEEAIPVSVVATQFKELVRSAGKLLDEQDEVYIRLANAGRNYGCL